MKALIVDDEKNSRELMHSMLTSYCPQVTEIVVCESAIESIFQINKFQPDLIFLDIEMPEMDGFALLDNIDSNKHMICFATGYEEFALKAISYGAFGYLLKPIDLTELKKVVKRADEKNRKEPFDGPDTLIVNQGKNIWVVRYKDISHIEAYGNHSLIHRSQEKIISDFSLSQLEELLPEWIMRTHRSHMVNISKVVKVEEGRTGLAIMDSGIEVPVASRRIKEFKEALKK